METAPAWEREGQEVVGSGRTRLLDAGLVKADFLGLKTLTVIDDCLKAIEHATHIQLI